MQKLIQNLMHRLIKPWLAAGAFAFAAGALCAAPAQADDTKKPAKVRSAKPAKSPAKGKKELHPKAEDVIAKTGDPEQDEPDITDTTTTEYNCELGNKVTIYQNDNDSEHIALRWKKRLHRLNRIGTTTGAQRFENKPFGLIWIGIPAKGMLLDSKLNRQLANECKNAEQSKPASSATNEAPASQPAA